MSLLIFALIVLIVAGLAVWLIDRSPFNQTIRWCMLAVVIVAAIVVLLQRAGLA